MIQFTKITSFAFYEYTLFNAEYISFWVTLSSVALETEIYINS